MVKLAQNAAYFEEQGAVGRAVQEAATSAAGGEGGRSADRDRRLPRHDDRRQPAERERDSREVRHEELPASRQQPRARRAAPATIARRVRARRPRRSRAATKYGEEAEDLLTAMHEVIGHGSGKLSDRAQGRRRAVPEGVLLDARGGARRPDGALEHLGSEAEGAGAGHGSGRGRARRCTTAPRARRSRSCAGSRRATRSRKITSATAQLIANYIMDKTGAIEQFDARRQDLRPGEGLPEDARGRRAAAGRADADQGGRRLRRDQGAGRQVRRALRPEAARPGGRALQGAESADLLGGHQRRS